MERQIGHTSGMEVAISIPDKLFERAEPFAANKRKSRSQVFSEAIREYLARHAPDEVTEAMDQALLEVNQTYKMVSSAAWRVLEQTEW